MNRNYVPYPTEVTSFEEAVEKSYGDIGSLLLGDILINNTLISKRYCTLFPCKTSQEIQQLILSRRENLLQVLGQNFADQIIDIALHQRLYHKLSEQDIEEIRVQFQESLHARNSANPIPEDPSFLSPGFIKTYRGLSMPLTFEPIPMGLLNIIKTSFDTMISECKQLDTWDFQTPPIDLFLQSMTRTAVTYYSKRIDSLLSCFPIIPVFKSIPFSEWGLILSIKWYEKILEHLETIEELQYKLEPFLLAEITSRALSLEMFLELETSTALEIQDAAKHACEKSHESKKPKTTSNSKYPSSIPWKRNEESLKALWQVLVDTDSVEDDGYERFRGSHFAIITQGQSPTQSASTHKIVWKGTLGNLMRVVKTLVKFGIIGIKPFKHKFNTEDQGKIINLITEHFCDTNGSDFDIGSVRKADQRSKNPDAKIDVDFNNEVLSPIRKIC